MLAAFGSKLATVFVQPTMQAITAGLLSGVIAGGSLVATGVVPGDSPPLTALLACPGSGAVMANVAAGQSVLAVARSEDGAWLKVDIGQPGIDGAWAPAAAVQLQGAMDGLPVADCAAPSTAEPTPQPLPSPSPTQAPTPSVAGTIVPTLEPTPGPTLPPGATASPSPKPTAPPVTAPPVTAPPVTAPPVTVPPVTSPPDTTKPLLSGLNANPPCISPGSATSTIQITATDNVAVLDVRITLLRPDGVTYANNQTMNRISGSATNGVYQYQVTASGWTDGYAQYVVIARDSSFNSSDPAVNDDYSSNNRLQYSSSGCNPF